MYRKILLILACLLLTIKASAAEIGFNERFALANERSKVLAELIPGTEDYFFYHILHHQNTGQLELVQPLIEQWYKQLGSSERYKTLLYRQFLLSYAKDNQPTLNFLRNEFGLAFNHQREVAQNIKLQSQLDPAEATFDKFLAYASPLSDTLNEVLDDGLEYLVGMPLKKVQKQALLRRIPLPDVPGLTQLVIDVLTEPDCGNFGNLGIHQKLTLAQLKELAKARPQLLGNDIFVNNYVKRLLPEADTDIVSDPAARGAYLQRLYEFVNTLPASQNTLKVAVLYALLDHERKQGRYDDEKFRVYLQLPRNARYVHPGWLQKTAVQREPQANLQQDFSDFMHVKRIYNDEPLVRDFLEYLLVDADNADRYSEWLEARYLNNVFAEIKLMHGIGDAKIWSGKLTPSQLQELRDRVEITFTPDNRECYTSDADVALQATIKNVPRLTLKIFDIDAVAFYINNKREINSDIDLDGLVANFEQIFDYSNTPPVRRHLETFALPQLKQDGVYVVELIGNGISSRALIRKGGLRFMERPGAAGHVFTIFDDNGAIVNNATIWMAGTLYPAESDGTIILPFRTTNPTSTEQIVLQRGRQATLANFTHEPEKYVLRVGALLERESMLEGSYATIVLRPLLLISDRPADLGLLNQVSLEITTSDVDKIASTQNRTDIKFKHDEDFVHTFKVPPRTVELQVRIKAKVRNLSQNRDDDLSATCDLHLNTILNSDRTSDIYLRQINGNYVLEARGLNGEILANRSIMINYRHRLFDFLHSTTLSTDSNGQIMLGSLPEISTISVSGLGTSHNWDVKPQSGVSLPASISVAKGEQIRLPAFDILPNDIQKNISLLSLIPDSNNEFIADEIKRVSVNKGFLELNDLPPGAYRLTFKRQKEVMNIHVVDTIPEKTVLVGKTRILERTTSTPLQVATLELRGSELLIQLSHVSANTRVHVIASRMDTGGLALDDGIPQHTPYYRYWPKNISGYMSSRMIGDEARYVLERQYAPHLPGNMLERPSLLLVPWSKIATDETEILSVRSPGMRSQMLARGGGGATSEPSARGRSMAGDIDDGLGILDFLPAPAKIWTNLRPDTAGVIKIPLLELEGRCRIKAFAIDGFVMAWRNLSISESAWQPRDRRLANALSTVDPITERKKATTLLAGETFKVNDLPSTKLEAYNTLAKVFRLFQSLHYDDKFARFSFITDWPDLTLEKQQELYSKFACHELNFFLYQKDRPFFDRVIKPFLANKRDKTFMDHWLLDSNLEKYLEPIEFSRLNTLELILLTRRLPAHQARIKRLFQDLYNLIPPDPAGFDQRFRTAIQSGGLEDGLGDFASASMAIKGERQVLYDIEAPTDEINDIFGAPATPTAPRRQSELKDKDGAVTLKSAITAKSMVPSEADPFSADAQFDRDRRANVRQLYRAPEKTKEWTETHYYEVPLKLNNEDLITINGFWHDYAQHNGKEPFLSAHLDEAAGNIAERICALAILDIPFKANEAEEKTEGVSWSWKPSSNAVVYHQQIATATAGTNTLPLMVVENFFDPTDRWLYSGAERIEKYIRDEFLTGRIYGAQVVLTNPTGAQRNISLLTQIPAGAIPVKKGLATRSIPMTADPYSTVTIEYYFYFPSVGDFFHFPATGVEDGNFAGRANPITCHVVEKPTRVDKASWQYISQYGTHEEVLTFLHNYNIHAAEIDLDRIAWRMQDVNHYKQTLTILAERKCFNATLWSYAIKHHDVPRIREFLLLAHPEFVAKCGMWLATPLLDVDAETLRFIEHKEYWPLINERVHTLGKTRAIANTTFFEQYNTIMNYLCYRPVFTAREKLVVSVLLLLQDRVDEAEKWVANIQPNDVETRMQADYLNAYLAFSRGNPEAARKIADQYVQYPVNLWRDRFRNIIAQANEISGATATVSDADKTVQVQDKLAAEAASLSIRVEGTKLEIRSRNLASCEIRYVPLDIELLFSRYPFEAKESAVSGFIRAAKTDTVRLGKGEITRQIDIPAEYRQKNVRIEASAEGINESIAYTPNAMNVQTIANYGQIRVRTVSGGRPVAGAYVKVYARTNNDVVRFHKDGYTDLRGVFDYASSSTYDLAEIKNFALLVLDDRLGAQIIEVLPPKQ